MKQEDKDLLIAKGRPDLVEIFEINESGYAGIIPNGNIVDRRKHPEAIPVPKNELLGIPEPKFIEWELDEKFDVISVHVADWSVKGFDGTDNYVGMAIVDDGEIIEVSEIEKVQTQ